MASIRAAAPALLSAALLLLGAGCTQAELCAAGEDVPCTCSDGREGTARCDGEGVVGMCRCGTSPSDAGPSRHRCAPEGATCVAVSTAGSNVEADSYCAGGWVPRARERCGGPCAAIESDRRDIAVDACDSIDDPPTARWVICCSE